MLKPMQKSQQQPPEKSQAQCYLEEHIADILSFKETKNLKDLLTHLEKYVKEEGGALTTSQLRNIFSKIKPMKTAQQLQLVRPQLAYVAARQQKKEARNVISLLERIVKEANDDQQVESFIKFFEAVVAYHKLHHGKS
jgi:CRISPR type III-A-associated protein Csm2